MAFSGMHRPLLEVSSLNKSCTSKTHLHGYADHPVEYYQTSRDWQSINQCREFGRCIAACESMSCKPMGASSYCLTSKPVTYKMVTASSRLRRFVSKPKTRAYQAQHSFPGTISHAGCSMLIAWSPVFNNHNSAHTRTSDCPLLQLAERW